MCAVKYLTHSNESNEITIIVTAAVTFPATSVNTRAAYIYWKLYQVHVVRHDQSYHMMEMKS